MTLYDVCKFLLIVVVSPLAIYWLLTRLKLIAGLTIVLCVLAIPAFISGAAETERHASALKKLKDERQKCIANIYRDMYNSCS